MMKDVSQACFTLLWIVMHAESDYCYMLARNSTIYDIYSKMCTRGLQLIRIWAVF